MKTHGFIIAACLRTQDHYNSLDKCIISILQHYSFDQIVVIIDFSSNRTLVDKIRDEYEHILFELDTSGTPAEMLTHSYFYRKRYFDIAIIIQDSMQIRKYFEKIDTTRDINYLWHFTNHRREWSIIREPETEFNASNNIVTHDDLIKYYINNMIPNADFKEYCIDVYNKKEKWSGCFGFCCIITYDFVVNLQKTTGIMDIMSKMISSRSRRVGESLFSLACQMAAGREIHESYDGLYYDGAGGGHGLTSEHIHKISFDRQ